MTIMKTKIHYGCSREPRILGILVQLLKGLLFDNFEFDIGISENLQLQVSTGKSFWKLLFAR